MATSNSKDSMPVQLKNKDSATKDINYIAKFSKEEIPIRIKYTVYGYMRKYSVLFIPQALIDLILFFYGGDIREFIAEYIYKKNMNVANELSPIQRADVFCEHLYVFRNEKLKQTKESINEHYPINEESFINQVIKRGNIKTLLIKLTKYVKKTDRDKLATQILQKFNDINGGGNEFIEYLLDLCFGSDMEWRKQQKQIQEWIEKQNVDILQIKKVEFSRKILAINQRYKQAQSGKLHKYLKNEATENCNFTSSVLYKRIVILIEQYMNYRKSTAKMYCIEANINKNSWSSKTEAFEFLTTLKVKQPILQRVIINLFGSIDVE